MPTVSQKPAVLPVAVASGAGRALATTDPAW
jgi:hypothetical protein